MSADPVVLDAAVRAFRASVRAPPAVQCQCGFCTGMIRGYYQRMLRERATPESHVVRQDG